MLKLVFYDNNIDTYKDIIKGLRSKGIEEIVSYNEFNNLYNDIGTFHTVDLFLINIGDKYNNNSNKIKILVDKFGNITPTLFLIHPLKTYKEIILYTWFNLRCFYSFKPVCFIRKEFYRDVGNALTTKRDIRDVKRYNFW